MNAVAPRIKMVYRRRQGMTVEPKDLESRAIELEAQGMLLHEQSRALLAQARKLRSLALEERARRGEEVTLPVQASRAVAISAGRSADPLVAACNRAGLTLSTLALRLGTPKSQLSGARRGHRPIQASTAARIEQITGFRATIKNWPGGIK